MSFETVLSRQLSWFKMATVDPFSDEICETSLPEELLNRKPMEPLQEECCGGGCSPCIFDIYDQELKIWRGECKRILNSTENEESAGHAAISEMQYSKFTITQVKKLTEEVYVYRFQIPNGCSLHLRAGQHLILRSVIDSVSVSRQYTPFSPLDAVGYFDVLIKIYENGLMSKEVSRWKEGTECEWRGPFGNFHYKANEFSHILMLAAGTGITPIIQIIKTVVDNEKDETRLCLIFSCSTYRNILLKEHIDTWKRFWNFKVIFHLTQETDKSKRRYDDEIVYERISSIHLNNIVRNFQHNYQVLVCGPRTFNDCLKDACLQDGIDNERIFVF